MCRVTCCGLANFQQHCSSKRHLRKAAAAGALAIPDLARGAGGKSGDDSETQQASNPTYVGLQAQCRNYCKQVGNLPSVDCKLSQMLGTNAIRPG